MSLADLKHEAALLPLEQRQELALFLEAIESEAEMKALLSKRMRDMDAGRFVTLEQLKSRCA